MHRCLGLARLGAGNVAPNPMVGSVLMHNNRVIGEGYHQRYGQAHAEVNCLASVKEEDKPLIAESTLYVSLEPCSHWGKTPPCADLILAQKIPKVVVGCRDPFPQVNGKGIEKLRAAGVETTVGVLEQECKELNRRFFWFHTQHRPYVILKWAQTLDQKIALLSTERLRITNDYTNRIVHKWRSEEAAIAVGKATALADDPQLNVRLWPGNHPLRIVVDTNLRLPSKLNLFDGSIPTIVFNKHQHSLPFEKTEPRNLSGVNYYQITEDASLVPQLLNGLYRLNVQSLFVEGGAQLLQSFIDEGAWDEARVLTNESMIVGNGLPAPQLKKVALVKTETVLSDVVRYYRPLMNA